MADTIQIKRGIKSDLPEHLAIGELAFCTDTQELYCGMGSDLPLKIVKDADLKQYTDEQIRKINETLNKIGGINGNLTDVIDEVTTNTRELKKLKTDVIPTLAPKEHTHPYVSTSGGEITGDLQVGGELNAEGGVYAKLVPIKIPPEADLNAYNTPGLYFCPADIDARTMQNVPEHYAFSLRVERHAGIKQVFTVYFADSPRTYVRNYYDSQWGAWTPVLLGNVDTNGYAWDVTNRPLRNAVPYIKSDEVMEVGKHIDFHIDDTTNANKDYDVRLTAITNCIDCSNDFSAESIWARKYMRINDWYGGDQDGRLYYKQDGKGLYTENIQELFVQGMKVARGYHWDADSNTKEVELGGKLKLIRQEFKTGNANSSGGVSFTIHFPQTFAWVKPISLTSFNYSDVAQNTSGYVTIDAWSQSHLNGGCYQMVAGRPTCIILTYLAEVY